MKWIILFLLGDVCYGFESFKSEIDYWKDLQRESTHQEKVSEKKGERAERDSIRETPSSGFDWSRHLDPKNEEFFREGNHLPPAPLMEVMRDPTDENIKNWFAYIDKKNEIAKAFHDKMRAYMAAHPKGESKEEEEAIAKTGLPKLNPPQGSSQLSKRFRIRFYFHSLCHHCQKMIETVNELQDQGFFVEGVVIDKNPKNLPPTRFAFVQADEQDLKARNISAWPVLLIGDLAKQKLFKINGFHTSKEIIETLSKI